MASESQNIEFKVSWRDEYLKWICGFANADGGTIFIGKDDTGNVVGIGDAKKLLEEIPNKVRDVLGILVDVNLHQTKQGDYLEIITEPYPNAISYKGQYHYRSGSTKQELKGIALDKFLLKKYGKHWDSMLLPNVSVKDLKQETLDFFLKKGVKNNRINEEALSESNEFLLENLDLTENGALKRATILLFHPKPEKFVSGAFIKIGYFESDSDLIFQDEVRGNLFEQVEKTVDLLFTKYIKAIISYDGIYRVETYEYPKEAVREALHNAIAHKDYAGAPPIQISVYKDKIMIWNYGQLPENWTMERLTTSKHPSMPYNPDIANAFFRIGYIEAWGRGFSKMTNICLSAGLPSPLYYYDMSGYWVVFRKDIYNAEHLKSLGLNDRQVKAVLYAKEKGSITNSAYQKINDTKQTLSSKELRGLVEIGIFKSTGTKGRAAKYVL